VPIVLTLHDISFVVHPEWFPWREGLRRRTLARLSARRAAAVVTVSATMRDEVVRVLGLPADRVHAVHSGLRRLTCSGDTARTAPHEPLVLFAGSVLNRRNLPDLIGAFARVVIREPGARLEIIGDNRTHPYQDLARLAEAAGVGARVALRSFVPDAALSDAYGRARVFVFLSDYEGFGFTPLEALAAGVPVVVQDTPVAREILGDAACFVRRGDLTGTAAAILRMLQDESARADQLARAAAVLGRYRWDRAARETLAVLTAAAGS
jgi:glycosyltransferase involved in cell wall biosynthesis